MNLYFKILLIIFSVNSFIMMGQQILPEIIVSKDGSGNYSSVQEAFNHIVDSSNQPIIIFIKEGIYKEKITLPAAKTNVVMIGENVENTILTFDDHSGKIIGADTLNTHNSYSTRIMGDNFIAYNITFSNNAGYSAGQAVALEINCDRAAFYNCRIIGDQDALYTNWDGRCYFKNCYIEGTTDFIFGKSTVLFDSCSIHCKKDSYITAASTPEGNKFGYVFLNCKITHADNISKVYLGRPWRDFAKVVYLNCYLDSHILAEGWHNWSKPWREKTAFFAEYNNSGPGSNTSGRVNWSYQLIESEALHYNLKDIFSAANRKIPYSQNWIPAKQFSYFIR